MDELREKVANRIFATGMLREREGGDATLWEAALKMTDFVLELPEIAEALGMARTAGIIADHRNELAHLVIEMDDAVNECCGCLGHVDSDLRKRIDAVRGPPAKLNLGPSISTNKRTPV